MIRYSLKCDRGHEFESWFASAASFDRLADSGHVSCAVCGTIGVEKAIMAPRVQATKSQVPDSGDTESREGRPLSKPASPAEQALKELRRIVETHAENVGPKFAKEARAIQNGDAPERAIYGKARPAEARSLVNDGIPVIPLPWGRERTN